MKPPAIRRLRCTGPSRRQERGITMVLVAIAMVAIIAMAALSIDVVTLYLAREEAQRSADTAALAAARVISLSGITGDPNNNATPSTWHTICGGPGSAASQTALAVATQNAVGRSVGTANVTYSAGGTPNPDCTTFSPGGAFSVNPMVTVLVTRVGLPTFFSRIWGNTGNTVRATATAEAFNPSDSLNSGLTRKITPVEPRCVKPWIVPNLDPGNPDSTCGAGGGPNCAPFVDPADGHIVYAGISTGGGSSNGVIGERFTLLPDCRRSGSTCILRDVTPIANKPNGGAPWIPNPPSLEYLPGLTANASVAVPSCAVSSSDFENAIEGCDQNTIYSCGVFHGNTVDLSENPGLHKGDTSNGVKCLINQDAGQDTLDTTSFPFQIKAGAGNPTGIPSSTPVTSSNSIVSLPIYDTAAITSSPTNPATIVGFLQVFINNVDTNGWGNVDVTVLNVVGCGNGTNPTGSPVFGSSPVPVRLITPP